MSHSTRAIRATIPERTLLRAEVKGHLWRLGRAQRMTAGWGLGNGVGTRFDLFTGLSLTATRQPREMRTMSPARLSDRCQVSFRVHSCCWALPRSPTPACLVLERQRGG